MGGKNIKNLKLAYNDVLRKDAVEYWRYEGNNSRMQKYHKISGILKIVNITVKWISFLYFLLLATLMLLDLIHGKGVSTLMNQSNYEIIMYIIEAYGISLVGWGIIYLINHWFKATTHSIDDYYKRGCVGMPLVVLVKMYIGANIITGIIMIVIIVLYFLITYINLIFIKNVDYLYDVATGKIQFEEVEENSDTKEVEVKVVQNKKRKKERRRK